MSRLVPPVEGVRADLANMRKVTATCCNDLTTMIAQAFVENGEVHYETFCRIWDAMNMSELLIDAIQAMTPEEAKEVRF